MVRVPLRLVCRNLFKHKVRSLLTVGSLAVAIFLLCLLRSLVVTLDAGVRAADTRRLVVQSAVSLFVELPRSYKEKIHAVDGVEEVAGWSWFGAYFRKESDFFACFAVDEEVLLKMYPEISVVEGNPSGLSSSRRACLIGVGLSRKFEWKVGDLVPIETNIYPRKDKQAWEFEVVAVYESKSPTVDNYTMFFPREYFDRTVEDGVVDASGGVGIYVITIEVGADPVAVGARVDALFANGPQRVQTCREAEFAAQFVSMVGNVPFFVGSIGMGVLFSIVLAVLNTMLMAAREQTHDAGLLKAFGFSSAEVFLALFLQGLLLCAAGGGLGVALALASAPYVAEELGSTFPYYAVTAETWLLGLLLTVVIGIVAGLVPAWRLSRLPAAATLRVEV